MAKDGNYDDTNSGVFFPPHDDQQFIGQGRLNVDGRDFPIMVIRHPLKKDGPPTMVMYARLGVLFPNTPKEGQTLSDKAPQYSGPLDIGEDLRVAGWTGENASGTRYCSLKVSPKNGGGGQAQGSPNWGGTPGAGGQQGHQQGAPGGGYTDDEIPF